MDDWRENIYFVLVEPKEPGNIGAAARAIKNMGFGRLSLTGTPDYLNDEARTFAHNAMDVLTSAEIRNSISDAIADKQFVAGTSRRRGRTRGVFLPVESGARRLCEAALSNKVAILFGREDRGLFNEEVRECAFLMTIPSSRVQPSLNLAQAVLIIAYELAKAGMEAASLLRADAPKLVSHDLLVKLYDRMEHAMKLIEYIPSDNRFLEKKIMQNLRHCLGRAGLTEWEFNMFHGICGQIEKKFGTDASNRQ